MCEYAIEVLRDGKIVFRCPESDTTGDTFLQKEDVVCAGSDCASSKQDLYNRFKNQENMHRGFRHSQSITTSIALGVNGTGKSSQ